MMRNQKIVPHLWFDTKAEQAIDFIKMFSQKQKLLKKSHYKIHLPEMHNN